MSSERLKQECVLFDFEAQKKKVAKVLLSDFATAKFFDRSHLMHRRVYTPLYCAPELLEEYDRSRKCCFFFFLCFLTCLVFSYTCAVDVFSLGVCIYNIVADGNCPFETEEETRAGKFAPVHDDLAQKLLVRMLEVDPIKRANMDEVLSSPFLLILDKTLRN
jgi:serine/threonine protein kinase